MPPLWLNEVQPITNQILTAGLLLTIPVLATDPDVPPQALT
jgi:hypothetical protein